MKKIIFYYTLAIVVLMGPSLSASASVLNVADSTTSSFSSVLGSQKHPLEDSTSWALHLERQSPEGPVEFNPQGSPKRRLQTAAVAVAATDVATEKNSEPEDNGPELPFEVNHKNKHKHVPYAGGDTTHGIMIDAGSVSNSTGRFISLNALILWFLLIVSVEILQEFSHGITTDPKTIIWTPTTICVARNQTSHIRVGQTLSARRRRLVGTIQGEIALLPDLEQPVDRQVYPGTGQICTIRGRFRSPGRDGWKVLGIPHRLCQGGFARQGGRMAHLPNLPQGDRGIANASPFPEDSADQLRPETLSQQNVQPL